MSPEQAGGADEVDPGPRQCGSGIAEASLEFTKGFADYPHLTGDPLLADLRHFEQFLPVAKAKWEDPARKLEDLPPL